MSLFGKKDPVEKAKADFIKSRSKLIELLKTSKIREIAERGEQNPFAVYDVESKQYTQEDIPNLFSTYIWVWRAVTYFAKHFARFHIYEAIEEDGDLRKHPEGRWTKLLKFPNPFMSEIEFKRTFMSYYLLFGEGYIEAVPGPDGRIAELYPINPLIIRPISDPIHFVKGFEVKDRSGHWHEVRESKIFYFKSFNPKDDVRGLARINPVVAEIVTDLYAISFNKDFFKKGARFDFALEADEELDDDVFDRLKKQFMQLHIGLGKFWSPPILDGGVKLKEFQKSHADMEYFEGRQELRREILAAFEIDERLIVHQKSGVKEDLREIKRVFLEDTIVPEVEFFMSKLESEIKYKLGEEVSFMIDKKEIPELNISEEEKSKIYDTYIKNGVITINEVRRRESFGDSVQWGDTWWMYKSLKPASAIPDGGEPGSTEGAGGEDSVPPDYSQEGNEDGQ